MRKRLMMFLTVLVLMVFAVPAAFAYNQYSIGCVVDGKHMSFSDASPYIDDNNRTMIPLRAVSEYLDCTVVWASDTQTISIYDPTKKVTYLFSIGQKSYTANGQSKEMDTTPVIKDGWTYVPVRYIGQLFGTVEWKDYTVYIYTSDEYKPSWRTDKAIQAKLAQGKEVKVDDVMTGLLEGSNSTAISFFKETEAEGRLTTILLDSDPFGCYYTELDRDGMKPFIQTPIKDESFYAYFIKDKKVYYGGTVASRSQGTIAYEPHYEPSTKGFDHIGIQVNNLDGSGITLYVFPLSMDQE